MSDPSDKFYAPALAWLDGLRGVALRQKGSQRAEAAAMESALIFLKATTVAHQMAMVEHRDAIDGLHRRIEELDVRLNSMPAVEYAGTWSAGKTYRRGQFVTRQGSLWHAQSDTTDMPGSSENWRLAVKRGTFG